MSRMFTLILTSIIMILAVGCGIENVTVEPMGNGNNVNQESTVPLTEEEKEMKWLEESEEVANWKNIYLNPEIKWGMSQKQVTEIEKRELNGEKNNLLMYNVEYEEESKLPQGDVLYSPDELWNAESYRPKYSNFYYQFQGDSNTTNKLVAYMSVYDSFGFEPDVDYISYQVVKRIFTIKHGECMTEDFQWQDEFFKDDDSKWNEAFKKGDFKIVTSWKIPETDTILILDWNNQSCAIKYIGADANLLTP